MIYFIINDDCWICNLMTKLQHVRTFYNKKKSTPIFGGRVSLKEVFD